VIESLPKPARLRAAERHHKPLGIGTTPPLVRYKRLLHFVGLRLPLRPAYLPRAARPVFDGHPPTEWGHDRDNEA
jgi:hypothetical protein